MSESTQELVQSVDTAVMLPANASQEDRMFMAIEVAISKGIPVETLEKMLDMQIQVMDRKNQQTFNKAMRLAQKAMPAVVAGSENNQTQSKYPKLEAIQKVIEPVYTKRGFACSFGQGDTSLEDHIRVVCDVSHDDGHVRQYHLDIPIDMLGPKGNPVKTKTHGTISAVTYGMNRLMRMIWNVRVINDAEDDDGNAAGQPVIKVINEIQANELHAMINDNGLDMEGIKNWLASSASRCTELEDIPAEFFTVVKGKIAQAVKASGA